MPRAAAAAAARLPTAAAVRRGAAQRRRCGGPTGDVPFAGVASQELVSAPEFRTRGGFPILRQMLGTGELVDGAEWPFTPQTARRMYEVMVRSSVYDTVLNEAQRQGRISFYLTNFGEEAASVASAAALSDTDMVWPQYRELPMFLWRGLTVDQVVDACMCNRDDQLKGRCLPVHYVLPGNTQAVKDPLATHLAQVPGTGYAFRVQQADRVAVAYFGDGAASEGDTPSGLNFASVLGAQALFVCRNNGFAISTPVAEQYAGDGVAARAAAFDIPACRVDGNDAVAVYTATKAARALCVERRGPVFLELMTYRVSHHSTSDDSSAYRDTGEVERWRGGSVSPIARLRKALELRGLWTPDEERALRSAARQDVRGALKRSETKQRGDPREMFTDTYDAMPPALEQQHAAMRRHVAAHRGSYNADQYAGV